MEEPEPPSEQLLAVAFLALDHAVASVRRGRVLVPFVLVEDAAGRELHRFAAKTLEGSQEAARDYLASRTGIARCALVYDGYLTLDEHRCDAVFVEAYEAGRAQSLVLAQRYEPRRGFRSFRTIGDPGDAGRTGPLLGAA